MENNEDKQVIDVCSSFTQIKELSETFKSAITNACNKSLTLHNMRNIDQQTKQSYINNLHALESDYQKINSKVSEINDCLQKMVNKSLIEKSEPKTTLTPTSSKPDTHKDDSGKTEEPFLSGEESAHSSKRGPYKIASPERRKKAIDMAKLVGVKEASKEYGIAAKNITRWLKAGSERKKGGGRKTQDPEMEKQLFGWIKDEETRTGQKVTRALVKGRARRLATVEGFKASKGWLDKFQKRYKVTFLSFTSQKSKAVFMSEGSEEGSKGGSKGEVAGGVGMKMEEEKTEKK